MTSGEQDNEDLALWQEKVSQTASADLSPNAGRPGAQADESSPLVPLLILRVGARFLALLAAAVREVVLKGFVTRVPLMPPHVLGVVLVRSRILPVISLEEMLGGSAPQNLAPTLPRLLIVETPEGELGIVADEVLGISEFRQSHLVDDKALPKAGGERPPWVSAELTWKDRLLCVLDVPQLLHTAAAKAGAAEARP